MIPMRANQAGFTLLEAIVAMVVFSVGAFALSGWLATNMIALQRVKAQQERERALASALDLVRRSNPMAQEEGYREVGDLMVRWTSRLIEPAKPAVSQSGTPGLYAVGLYRMQVKVLRGASQIDQFEVRQVGWRQVRASPEP